MKIATIALKDFRIYHDAEVEFDEPLSVIRGANHQGKTTLKQALELALTRRSDGTSANGAGSDDKIRQGAKKAEVTVGVETRKGIFEASMSQTHSGRSYTIPKPFENYLQANSARWSSVLDPEFFISQPEKEQKAILSALIAPTEYEFDPKMIDIARRYEDVYTGILADVGPIEFIESIYDKAFKARTKAKAALDAIRIPESVPAPQYTVAKIREYLEKLRDELGAEQGPAPQVIDNAAQIGRLEGQLLSKQNELDSWQQRRTASQNLAKEYEGQMLTGPQMTKFKKTAESRAKFAELALELAEIDRKRKGIEEKIGTFEDLSADGCCPTCQQTIPAEFVAEVIDGLRSSHKGYSAQIDGILRVQKDLGDIAGAEAKLREHDQAKEKKLTQIRQVTESGEKITAIGKEIVALNQQLEALRNTPEATPEVRDTSDIKAKIEAWERKLLEANTYETRLEQITAAEASRKAHAAAVADLETLCKYFGKDGVKADIIKASIDGFQSAINRTLENWGYAAELSVEPFRFLVTTADSKILPLKELSGSERLMFGVALQSAIAIQSGIRLMVIDRADTFINGERGRLFSGVKSLLDDGLLDQAIVMVSDERTEVPEQPGVAFFRVEAGRIERLGQPRDEEAAA